MQLKRVAAVTVGLGIAGALMGALCGAVMMLAYILMEGVGALIAVEGTGGHSVGGFVGHMVLEGMLFGAALGAVLGPLSAWLLMRHVPIGLALGGTALGTLVGAVIGIIMSGLEGALVFGLGGFAVAALALWIRTPRGSRAAAAGDPSA
jgi:hypothetical protein